MESKSSRNYFSKPRSLVSRLRVHLRTLYPLVCGRRRRIKLHVTSVMISLAMLIVAKLSWWFSGCSSYVDLYCSRTYASMFFIFVPIYLLELVHSIRSSPAHLYVFFDFLDCLGFVHHYTISKPLACYEMLGGQPYIISHLPQNLS
jgi:hypothetical protein